MNLLQIITDSLNHMGYGSDPQTIEVYMPRFTSYVNEAVRLIAEKYRKTKSESVTLDSDHIFSDTVLASEVMNILYIEDSDGEIQFYQKPPRSGNYYCSTEEYEATVSYEYYPETLTDRTDEPDLPPHLHGMIHYFVTARARTGNDADTQQNSAADYQLFNSYLARVNDAGSNDVRSATIKNWY